MSFADGCAFEVAGSDLGVDVIVSVRITDSLYHDFDFVRDRNPDRDDVEGLGEGAFYLDPGLLIIRVDDLDVEVRGARG